MVQTIIDVGYRVDRKLVSYIYEEATPPTGANALQERVLWFCRRMKMRTNL